MSKMSEISETIEELRSAAATIASAADWLAQQFSTQDDKQQSNESAAKPKPALKLEDVRAVLSEKSRAGHTAEVRKLLGKFGTVKLSEVDPRDYEALMKEAEAIGDGT